MEMLVVGGEEEVAIVVDEAEADAVEEAVAAEEILVDLIVGKEVDHGFEFQVEDFQVDHVAVG